MFKSLLNCPSSTSGCRSVAGRLYHTFGPATEKLLSPSRVLVRGTVRTLASAERRQRCPESAISWQSSARYDGISLRSDLKTIIASLKMTRCFTGSSLITLDSAPTSLMNTSLCTWHCVFRSCANDRGAVVRLVTGTTLYAGT